MTAAVYLIAALAALAVTWAAFEDLLFRRIPNTAVGAVLAAAVNSVLQLKFGVSLTGSDPTAGLLVALTVLSGGFVLYLLRAVGAGDVKMAFALSLLFGDMTPEFLVVTSLAGGVMVLLLPILRLAETKLALAAEAASGILDIELRRTPVGLLAGEKRKGLPYGPALAAGAFFVLTVSLL